MQGGLRKMEPVLGSDNKVSYTLHLDGKHAVDMNKLIGKTLRFTSDGSINCVHCGSETPKSYSQGHCFTCHTSLASCDQCRVQPEKCHYAAGTCREPSWGEENCMTKHFVYIAYSSGFKVGICRGKNLPSRWLDQGAVVATTIFEVSERLLSGLVETAFKEHVSDRTNWRKMLLEDESPSDAEFNAKVNSLVDASKDAIDQLQLHYGADAIVRTPVNIVRPEFPIKERPFAKVKNPHKFEKTPVLEGVLHGIKGQYLFVGDTTINVRANSGFNVNIDVI